MEKQWEHTSSHTWNPAAKQDWTRRCLHLCSSPPAQSQPVHLSPVWWYPCPNRNHLPAAHLVLTATIDNAMYYFLTGVLQLLWPLPDIALCRPSWFSWTSQPCGFPFVQVHGLCNLSAEHPFLCRPNAQDILSPFATNRAVLPGWGVLSLEPDPEQLLIPSIQAQHL